MHYLGGVIQSLKPSSKTVKRVAMGTLGALALYSAMKQNDTKIADAAGLLTSDPVLKILFPEWNNITPGPYSPDAVDKNISSASAVETDQDIAVDVSDSATADDATALKDATENGDALDIADIQNMGK